ncbi:MAG: hypothetical protein AAF466_03275, partial [Bacteroidota bacterium]
MRTESKDHIEKASKSEQSHSSTAIAANTSWAFEDNRSATVVQQKLQGIANDSPQSQRLGDFVSIANSQADSSEEVIQGVFVYSFEANAIHAANKDGSYYEGIGFKTYLSKDGHTVWANPDNGKKVASSTVEMGVLLRQERIARGKLAKGVVNSDEHEIRDKETGLSFIHEGTSYHDKLIIQAKGMGQEESAFALGSAFCMLGESLGSPGKVIEVTEKMVNDFWETPKEESDESFTPQGSFSPTLGYTRDEGYSPDERYNCAAYAKGKAKLWIEPVKMHEILKGKEYIELSGPEAMKIGVDYVCATTNHFWRAKKVSKDEYKTSEKNGTSAVYKRTLTAAKWEDFI